MSEEKSIRQILTEEIATCQNLSVNGTQYFGKVKKDENGIVIYEAVQAAGSLESTVTSWLKAFNLDKLETLSLQGDMTLVEKSMNKSQKETIELLVLRAAQAARTALPNLINSSF